MIKEINRIIYLAQSEAKPDALSASYLVEFAKKLIKNNCDNNAIHTFLEVGHFSKINRLFNQSALQNAWVETIFELIKKSKFYTGCLFKQRAKRYSNQILFQTVNGKKISKISYQQAWNKVQKLGVSIQKICHTTKQPVIGLYTPNSLESACIDLACLSFNFKIVPIPANSSTEHLLYIMQHAGITHLFVGGQNQSDLINSVADKLKNLETVALPNSGIIKFDHIAWKDFVQNISTKDLQILNKRADTIDMNGRSTIMYTSGTTANPKGIIFTQTNIITKRFARAIALPDVDSNDTFLCYLPLYHTFGRYLEMMGALFWGATYTFAESPSFKSLVMNMQTVKPSIFISIPKRWLQLYELFLSDNTVDVSNKQEFKSLIDRQTGGKLHIGLSAAGYLDPDVFQFFHKNNIQLLSGYGMTEATGGITMTQPNNYVKNSVGIPLPGIGLKLGKDSELLLRGDYVTGAYHGKKVTSSLKRGWFHTGDIFEQKDGHYFIIDRKKEIYKNSRGLTISPQKIENMFQDFDAVKSVFLIGDGMPYNTVLLYPDVEWLQSIENEQDFILHEYFSSLLQSVNSFLAPYERIVNFAIIDRDFSIELGELTKKRTYKRKIILKNFADNIQPMYEVDYYSIIYKTNEIRIPKWILSKADIIVNHLKWDGKKLSVVKSNKSMPLIFGKDNVQIGDFQFKNSGNYIDLRKIILAPALWLGNISFVDFFGFETVSPKYFEQSSELTLDSSSFKFIKNKIDKNIIDALKHALRDKIFNLRNIHYAATILYNDQGYNLSSAINYLAKVLAIDKTELADIVIVLLSRLRYHPSYRVRMKVLEILTPKISSELFIEMLIEIFLSADKPGIINEYELDVRTLKTEHFKSILRQLEELRYNINNLNSQQLTFSELLLRAITEFGIRHPMEYKWARAEMVKWNLSSAPENIISVTSSAIEKLISGFRAWLGPNRTIAIDNNSNEEYSWKDTINFDQNVLSQYKDILYDVLSNTHLVKETIFLLSNYQIVDLDNIQTQGIWIILLRQGQGKIIFRVTVQTRDNKTYNFVINLFETKNTDFILDEIKHLIVTGSASYTSKLVEDFGGYWLEYKIFTEEYVQGETLYQYLERNRYQIASKEKADLWQLRWLHFIWNGAIAYFNFFRRSNFKYYISDSSPKTLIIPEHDYEVGTRLISISHRVTVETVTAVMLSFYDNYIIKIEQRYDGLEHVADWEVLFCVLLQTVSVKKGIELLKQLTAELENRENEIQAKKYKLTENRITKFIDDVNENGLLIKQVVFASLRYERWLALNPKATTEARGSILKQLYIDYDLENLIDDYPETRIRFFLITAFKDSKENVKKELLLLQKGLRTKTISTQNLDVHLNNINNKVALSDYEKYFLARLVFAHIDASGKSEEFVWDSGTEGKLDLISAITDNMGEKHQIREPLHPKEIAKFQTLLFNANLMATFNQQHEFLFVFNSNNQLIGGVYWIKTDESSVYLERIVIHPNYRNRKLSSILLDELFNRLRNKRYKYITVGFFQAGLFYNKGFIIDKRFGGLVKKL